jgi:hypothetical protein
LINFFVGFSAAGYERGEWQTYAQALRAIGSLGAERSQTDGVAMKAGDEFSIRERFERDMTADPGGNGRPRRASLSLCSASAQAGG